MRSHPHESGVLTDYARRIAQRLTFHGPWFFQVREDRAGQPRLLEVAPRIAGTMALNRVLGVNFPLLALYEQDRVPVEIAPNTHFVEIDRALVNRYRHDISFETAYIDLDDTLILRGRVNTLVIRFIYQCLNEGKRVVLITRHGGPLTETLARFRLADMWDEIIHVPLGEEKADHIRDTDAIFVDDSFRERQLVSRRWGIPTMDCAMLEVLLDDRV
jgi:hypothetical protein